jgi:drug/metabolite transporter (DMT)-like permease
MKPPRRGAGLGPAVGLTLLTGIWGYNWVIIKLALTYAEPLTFSTLRALLGALALFAVLIALRRPLKPARGWSLVLLGLLQTAGFVGFVSLSLESGAVGKSAVVAYTMPFWTLLLAGPLLGERVRGVQWLAVALAALGLAGILSPWRGTLGLSETLLAFGAAWCWAFANIIIKRMRLDDSELLNVSAWQTLVGGAGLAALAWIFDSEPVQWTTWFTVALIYNVIVATALAWLVWIYALSRLSAGAAGLSALGIPVVSLATAWLQLGERPTLPEALGMAMILGALAILSLGGWRRFSRAPSGA